MPKRKRVYEDDDGRTIADMSGVSGPSMFLPKTKRQELEQVERSRKIRPEDQMNRQERRMYILGALKATLMIGAVYLVGFGLIVGLLVLIWNH